MSEPTKFARPLAPGVAAIAVWAAVVFGALEAALLCFTRLYPNIRAPYKVSAQVLWIAPVVDGVVFLMIALFALPLLRVIRDWRGRRVELAVTYGLFTFLGVAALLTSTDTLHWLAAVTLTVGTTVAITRYLVDRGDATVDTLQRRIIWAPLMVIALAAGSIGYERVREAWAFRKNPAAQARSPNILMLLLDTVRRDRLGRGHDLTPNLDRLRLRGVSFSNAWPASSWSLPSQASLLTGLLPHEHGADWPGIRLRKHARTLAEYLHDYGYATGAFSGNAAWITPEHLGRGFDEFRVYRTEDIARRTAIGSKLDQVSELFGYHYAGRGRKAPELNQEFLRFLDRQPERPFFGYICYMDANQGLHHRKLNRAFWQPHATTAEVVAAYDAALRKLDADIGALITELERRGALENTILVITSDHGESFGSENFGDHDPDGHGTSLYPEQLRVPLLMIYPPALPGNGTVPTVVSNVDVARTITEMLPFGDTAFAGKSLWRHYPQTQNMAVATLNYSGREAVSLAWQRWQYIETRAVPTRQELFDLDADSFAVRNLTTNTPLRATMQSLLRTVIPTAK